MSPHMLCFLVILTGKQAFSNKTYTHRNLCKLLLRSEKLQLTKSDNFSSDMLKVKIQMSVELHQDFYIKQNLWNSNLLADIIS